MNTPFPYKGSGRRGLFGRAVLFALAVTVLDQLCKWYMLEQVNIDERPPIEVFSWFNLVMVWNHGVSFGMLAQHGSLQPLILVGLTGVVTLILLIWLSRARQRFVAFSLAAIVGGAVGNIIDRIRFGAVADFFDVHAYGYHWPAFNIADAAIFIGVALLVYHSIFLDRSPRR